jgi:hypothetical protein
MMAFASSYGCENVNFYFIYIIWNYLIKK